MPNLGSSSLLSHGTASAAREPFFHLRIDNFLPAEQYQALLESFPTPERLPETIEGNKKRLSSRTTPDAFEKFRRSRPVWAQLFEQLAAAAFLADVYEAVREPLREARGAFAARPWRVRGSESAGFVTRALTRPVKVTFELSRLETGSIVSPHTDAAEKLVTMMLYFPEPGWQESYGGGTVFYRAGRPNLNRNWTNYRVPFEDVSPVCVNQFAPNRLCIFLKSKNSYHGVPAITCPEGMARNSLNLNVFRRKPAHFGCLLQAKDRLLERLERRGLGRETASRSAVR